MGCGAMTGGATEFDDEVVVIEIFLTLVLLLLLMSFLDLLLFEPEDDKEGNVSSEESFADCSLASFSRL